MNRVSVSVKVLVPRKVDATVLEALNVLTGKLEDMARLALADRGDEDSGTWTEELYDFAVRYEHEGDPDLARLATDLQRELAFTKERLDETRFMLALLPADATPAP